MKLFRQVILLTLALLVLVSSTGFSIGMHLCAGELNDLSFYGKATECLMEQKKADELPPCHAPKNEKSDQDNCCEDHQLVVDSLDEASASRDFLHSHLTDIKFIATLQVVILQLFAPDTEPKPSFAHYSAPQVVRDIPVLVQSFLI